ncbi:MAG: UTP--glucose-1-phosphate uridylyltransferase [Alphaproteobacteria bacterium ADurb.BinA305]|nr:MAG: UTP--glucose-1-phosphate uridylyltransferase [Alphaproteobacteria bacterium ADurb.BinA305]
MIAEEALAAGIEEICIVCAPGDEEQYLRQFRRLRANLLEAYRGADWAQEQADRVDNLLRRLHFAAQEEPRGYGEAVLCAREFTGGDPFLLLLGDHLYVSDVPGKGCAQQVIDLAVQEECAVAAVHPTREHLIGSYGTLTGRYVGTMPGVYQIERIIEKPSLSIAELELQTPGLRAGHYLCFFGMHVLTPRLFGLLAESVARAAATGGYQLTPVLQELAHREKYLALEVRGSRYDIGRKFGLLKAQIALSTAGRDREEVLSTLVELLSEAGQRLGRQAGGSR